MVPNTRLLTDLDALLPLEQRGAEVLIAQTDLCPAVVVLARSREVRLFAGLEAWGLEGPTRVAIPTAGRVEVVGRADPFGVHTSVCKDSGHPFGVHTSVCNEMISGSRQAEAWLLCWFEGGRWWDSIVYGQPCHWRGRHPERPFPHIDVPWLVVLQHKADRIALDADGLALEFPREAGTLVLMPLFGVDFQPVETTRAWRTELPPEISDRCRRWTRYLREIPIACHESFEVSSPRDSVLIRQDFDYLSIEDEWGTPADPIAPYPPFITLASRYGFPVKLESPPEREQIATLYGPYAFRRGARSSSYELHGLLRYIRTDEIHPGAPASPAAERAAARLRRKIENDPRLAVKTSGGFTRGLALALASYAQALPYLDASQQDAVRPILRELLERLLDPAHYMPLIRYPSAGGAEPVGEAVCQQARDAYKVVQANLYGAWTAGAALGEWDRLREAWPLLRRWFHLPFQTQWATALPARWEGLDIARALFDGTIGYARLAAQFGAADEYRAASCLFAKVCAGWFAMESMPRYHREHAPWLFNTETEYLIWHPCRINGYVLIARDHLFPHEDPKVDSRGWAGAFGRLTASSARFWRDHLRARADEVLNTLLPRCRPDWAQAGAPAVMRAYVLGESAEALEARRPFDKRVEQDASGAPLRARTYRLFQSTPVLKEIAMIEAGSPPVEKVVISVPPPTENEPADSMRQASRMEPSAMPVRIATAGETGSFPLLYWPGLRTPRKAFDVLDSRLDVLPFGMIKVGDENAETAFRESEAIHPNACLTLLTHHAAPIESVSAERREDGSYVIQWTTPLPADSIVQYWRDDLEPEAGAEAQRRGPTVREGAVGAALDHCVDLPALPDDEMYWFRALSFDGAGGLHRSRARMLPGRRANWAFGCAAYASKRFPFKEFKYAPDRERRLAEFHRDRQQWQALKPPHELTDGRGLRPATEPWIRHAEPDPEYRHWIAIDLGRPRPVDEVIVAHDPGWIAAGLRIEAGPGDESWSARMADAAAWNERAAEATANRSAIVRLQFALRTTRWIRVYYTQPAPVGLTANRLVLWEIEVRGPNG